MEFLGFRVGGITNNRGVEFFDYAEIREKLGCTNSIARRAPPTDKDGIENPNAVIWKTLWNLLSDIRKDFTLFLPWRCSEHLGARGYSLCCTSPWMGTGPDPPPCGGHQ